ncbi:hypothetical protein SB717_27395 [Priestia sp. SIMBA_032]|uniref:hypothetical protein n=1 Tax=Priestia sp. SIMBA_032 TaxID=3085775 RepID=UPI003979AB51
MKDFLLNGWDDFKVNFSFIAIILAGLGLIIRSAMKSGIKFIYDTKLEEVKKDFNSQIEDLKHNQQKLMFSFESYNSKRREMYPEFYALMQDVIGYTFHLRGIRTMPDIRRLTVEELGQYLETLEISHKEMEMIKLLHSSNIEEAVRKTAEIRHRYDYHLAKEKLIDANNYFLYKELFFSETVAEKCVELLDDLFEYINNHDPMYLGNAEIFEANESLAEKIPNKVISLKKIMREEFVVEE